MDTTLKLEDLVKYIKHNCIKQQVSTTEIMMSPQTPNITQEQEIINVYFDDKIKYHKVLNTIPDTTNNVSLIASFLSCVISQFDTIDKSDKAVCITKFFAKLLTEIRKRDGLTKYITPTLTWDKKELVNALHNFTINQNVIAYIATYMNINILILNTEDITVYCTNRQFNTYKPSIVLLHCCEEYYPLSYEDKKVWYYQELPIFRNFLDNNIQQLHIYQQGKTTQTGLRIGYDDDVELFWIKVDQQLKKQEAEKMALRKRAQMAHMIDTETEQLSEKSSEESEESEEESDSEDEIKKYTIEELTQMKCVELKSLTTKRKIKATVKIDGKTRPMNKKELISVLSK